MSPLIKAEGPGCGLMRVPAASSFSTPLRAPLCARKPAHHTNGKGDVADPPRCQGDISTLLKGDIFTLLPHCLDKLSKTTLRHQAKLAESNRRD